MIDRRLILEYTRIVSTPFYAKSQTCFSSPAAKLARILRGVVPVQSAQIQPLLQHRISRSRRLVDRPSSGKQCPCILHNFEESMC